MKTWFRRLVLLLASSAVSVAILEIGLRKALPFYDPRRQILFEEVAEVGCALGPRGETIRQRTPKGDYDLAVGFNPFGLRDPKNLLDATARDLFVVGDSFSMGWGVEEAERYSDRVQALTGRRVFNAAIPNDLAGYLAMLRYLRTQGAVVSNLVVGVCMNNDIRDYGRPDKFTPVKYGDASKRIAYLRAWLQGQSAIYLYLSFEIQRYRPLRKLCEKLGISRDINEITLRNLHNPAAIAASLEQAQQVASTVAPGHCLFLIIPSLALWEGDNTDNESRIHTDFVAGLAQRGLALLDMRPVLEATGVPRLHYFETDPHWNARGHALAGRALAERLGPAHP